MSRRKEKRSTAAPMDFEFTSNRELPPDSPFRRSIEALGAEKRSRMDMETEDLGSYGFGGASTSNVPFLFNLPAPATNPTTQWTPPVDTPDVQMQEASPAKPNDDDSKGVESRPVALGAVRRVYHMRERMNNRSRGNHRPAGSGDDYDSETDDDMTTNQTLHTLPLTTSNHYTLNMHGPSSTPSHLPYVLLGYLQFIFNTSLILVFLYLLVTVILTIQRDVEQRIAQYSLVILQEIAMCTASYKANNCADPLPALVHQCSEWEACMARDPAVVGRAKVGAEMLAEVINGFVEPISWKTLLFTLSSVAFFTAFVNSMINLYRSKHHPVYAYQPQPVASNPTVYNTWLVGSTRGNRGTGKTTQVDQWRANKSQITWIGTYAVSMHG